MKTQSFFLTVIVLFFVIPAQAGIQPSFQGLGDLPGGNFYSEVLDVSADGSVVVGKGSIPSGFEAFRWENGQMTGLGHLSNGVSLSYATTTSSDGLVIVGCSSSASGLKAFRWENGTMVSLGVLPGHDFRSNSSAWGVSADGSVVVGLEISSSTPGSPSRSEAFRWENGQMVGLGDLLGGGFYSFAFGVSADGSIVVGKSESSSGKEAFRWEDGQMVGLGDLPGGDFESLALNISADGSVIVGGSKSASGQEAFRWENGIMTGLGDLPGGEFESYAYDVSADGTVVVGFGSIDFDASFKHEAFIWDAENGMRNLKDVLINDCGLDLTGWILRDAMGISDDGLTIVGNGINPYGCEEGWIATIPEPATILLLGLGGLFIRKRKSRISK